MINIMWTVRYIVTERFACLGFFQGSIVRVLQLNEENYFPHISYIYIYMGVGGCVDSGLPLVRSSIWFSGGGQGC